MGQLVRGLVLLLRLVGRRIGWVGWLALWLVGKVLGPFVGPKLQAWLIRVKAALKVRLSRWFPRATQVVTGMIKRGQTTWQATPRPVRGLLSALWRRGVKPVLRRVLLRVVPGLAKWFSSK